MSLLKVMLDTNIASAIINQSDGGAIYSRLLSMGIDRTCLSIITVAEIKFGLVNRPSRHLEVNAALLFDAVQIAPFEAPADEAYAEIRAHLRRAGAIIGPNDLFIAAHALALDLTLITNNIREFSRVPNLRVENWLD